MTISSWHIEFTRPLWFALLTAMPLLLVFWRKSLVQFSRGRQIASLLLRSLLVLLVAAGLAGPKATGPSSQPNVDFKWVKSGGGTLSPPAVEIAAPDHVRAGEPFSVKVLLRSKKAGAASVELLRDSQSLTKKPETVTLVAGENHTLFSAVAPTGGSRAVYSVTVKDEQGALARR